MASIEDVGYLSFVLQNPADQKKKKFCITEPSSFFRLHSRRRIRVYVFIRILYFIEYDIE